MTKPDVLDRVAQILIALVAAFALFNGGFMLADPFGWYQTVGTVKFTGPPNQHFIRDIGLAFLASGLMLAYAARWPNGRIDVFADASHEVMMEVPAVRKRFFDSTCALFDAQR